MVAPSLSGYSKSKALAGLTGILESRKSLWLAVGLICALTAVIAWPLFTSELLTGHDSRAAYIRVLGMREYFGSGQIFVRWFPDLNWGYGGPMFNFYPPLFYFLTTAVGVFIGHPSLTVNLTLYVLWCLSGVSMFFLVRHYWGGWAGLVSAVAYVFAPYHVVDVFTRGAYAEFTAFPLLPFLLLGLSRLAETLRVSWFFAVASAMAALFLAHNATCLMFIPFLALYCLLVLAKSAAWRWKTGVLMGSALALGAAMAAFFWVPALSETSAIRTDFLIHGRYDFWKNFLEWKAVLYPPWPLPSGDRFSFDGIYFDLGGWQILLAVLTLVVLTLNQRFRRETWRVAFFLVLAAVAFFMVIPCSRPVWEKLRIIHFVQLPWRYLVLTTLGISVLAGGWLKAVSSLRLKVSGTILCIVLMGVSGVMITSRPSMEPAPTAQPQKQIFSTLLLGEGERTPRWIQRPPSAPALKRVLVAQGKVSVYEVNAFSKVDYTFTSQAASAGVLVANIFYYPGWHVYIDGKDTNIEPDPIHGRIFFSVPYGEHQVRIKLELTTVQFWSIVVSWGAFCILLVIGWIFYRR